MDQSVQWLLELSIRAGQSEALAALMAEMVAATRASEPGTLNYQWHVSADGETAHIHERYADPAAVMQHMAAFQRNYAERFMQILKPERMVVYGTPDEQVIKALAPLHPQYFKTAGGFRRN